MATNPLYGIPLALKPAPSAEVVHWRLRRLRDAGFGDELASALAIERDVDLHALLNLVDKGCPPHLAARIMGSRASDIGADSCG